MIFLLLSFDHCSRSAPCSLQSVFEKEVREVQKRQNKWMLADACLDFDYFQFRTLAIDRSLRISTAISVDQMASCVYKSTLSQAHFLLCNRHLPFRKYCGKLRKYRWKHMRTSWALSSYARILVPRATRFFSSPTTWPKETEVLGTRMPRANELSDWFPELSPNFAKKLIFAPKTPLVHHARHLFNDFLQIIENNQVWMVFLVSREMWSGFWQFTQEEKKALYTDITR